ncbi:MFS transporter [Bacillus sp. CLL-7-23]|uniref:MFS transporter n=1 Tax=Bacillus changyiensis TaxID=3004103 RepID=A0ABT4X550_9BACI|nr:MFS transporter [Bacillus changyiensis]MDA7027425.1 MFS transporter [Bacillus changyiensis]
MKKIFIFGCSFYFLVGIIHILLGSLSPYIIHEYHRDLHDLSFLIFFQFIGFLNGVLLAPIFVRRSSHTTVLTYGLLLILVTLLGVFIFDNFLYFVVMGFLLGFGAGTLETTMGAYVITQDKNAKGMNILEVFFGLGALLFPFLIFILVEQYSWNIPLYVLFLFVLVLTGLWFIFLRGKGNKPASSQNTCQIKPTATAIFQKGKKEKNILFFLIFAFFYAGIETNFANFLPALMCEKGADEISVISVSFFWMGMVFGRFLLSLLGNRLTSAIFLIFSTGILTGLLFTLAWLPHHGTQILLIFCIGFSAAGIFPCAVTLTSLAGKPFTEEMTSFFISSASLGGALLAFLIGWAIDFSTDVILPLSLFTGMGLLLIVISGIILFISLQKNKQSHMDM